MQFDRVVLRHLGGGAVAHLDELAGVVEREVESPTTRNATQLLDRLLLDDGSVHPGGALDLSVSDRDALLAAVLQRTYGDRVESTVRCRRCGNRFDLSFSLAELLRAAGFEGDGSQAEGRTESGVPFRAPTGRDELEIEALPGDRAAELRRRIAPTAREEDAAELDSALGQTAPVLDIDLDARCPECSRHQQFHFNAQTYLLESLAQERPQLWWEVHRIASAYGWSLESILNLRRSERRRLVSFIDRSEAAGR
jgi:hypothetical protein